MDYDIICLHFCTLTRAEVLSGGYVTREKQFFQHVTPYMDTMARLTSARRPPAELMGLVAEDDRRRAFASASRNDPCPCGSGKKFKLCCGGNM